MPKDRLADLKALQGEDATEFDPVLQKDVEAAKQPFLDDFFGQIEEYQQTLRDLKEKIVEIKKHHGTILSSPQPDERVKEELEKLVGEVQSMMNGLKLHLKKMDKNIKEQETSNRPNYAEIRIKKCQHATLGRELVDIMSDYDTIQNTYKENCKNRIKRQLQIVNPNTPIIEDAAFEEMIESDNPAIFTQGIITETQQAKNSLREIEARHNDIIHLENSIKQLHELFTDVAHFVSSQGEMIDRIEYNVQIAGDHVEDAVKETKKAVTYRTSAMKKKVICIVICIVILGVIALAVALSLNEWNLLLYFVSIIGYSALSVWN